MHELISLQPHDTLIQAVNARELHSFLESKQDFSTWIKKRIADYDFVENQDFVTFSENYEKGRPRLEYALTLDKTSLLGLRTVLRNTSSWKMRITCSTNLWSRPLAVNARELHSFFRKQTRLF